MGLNVEQRKMRWRKLYENNPGYFVYRIELPDGLEMPKLWPENRQKRLDWALNLYRVQMERINWLDDDSVPHLSMTSGTEIFAEAIGCKVYRPADNMPFAIPMVHSVEEAASLKIPKVEDTPLMDLIEMARSLKQEEPDAVLKLPDIQSPMDILAQVWDKTDLFVNMIDEPELVKELSSKICGLLTHFLDLWFGEFGHAYIAHHPDYYMEGGLTLSADEIGNVNQAMFDEFFLDELNVLSDHFGGIGIHCCANSKHQWEGLKRVKNMKLLNLARPMDTLQEGFRAFTHCAHYPYLLIDGTSHPMPDMYPQDFPSGTRAVIVQWAQNEQQAGDKAEALRRLCGGV